ncbi:MAG: hypothetical protein ACXAD7_07725 [Candidatus Kariarchaeaceae archaeon]|jgi:hypothetical protein
MTQSIIVTNQPNKFKQNLTNQPSTSSGKGFLDTMTTKFSLSPNLPRLSAYQISSSSPFIFSLFFNSEVIFVTLYRNEDGFTFENHNGSVDYYSDTLQSAVRKYGNSPETSPG